MNAMALIGAALLLLAGEPAERGVESLNWMVGHWSTEGTGAWTEEHWAPARGGVMLGTNLSGKGERAGGYEFMRLASGADGKISFWGSPGGQPPVEFKLVRSGPSEAIFENPAHDYPQRVRYWRDGELLRAEVSDMGGAQAMRWTFKRMN